MFRVCWRQDGDRYFRRSEVFYDIQDAKNYVRMLRRFKHEDIHIEKAEWKKYPSVEWVNRDN